MLIEITLVSLFVLIVASITDLRTLEVPDWLNFMGIAAGLGIHLIISAQQWNYWPILSSLIGVSIAFGLACLMFYTGQWGGGDAKLLMAMGALIGFEANKLAFGTSFLINLVFLGGAWGLIWIIFMTLRNWTEFKKTFTQLIHEKQYMRLRLLTIITTAGFLVLAFVIKEFKYEIIGLAIATYTLTYLTISIKATEKSCMQKWITPDKLTEGDWLLKPVKANGITIKPQKLGLEKQHVQQIQKLYKQHKIKKVLVKYGVPFAPAFLFAFIATLIWNNIIFTLLF